MESYQPIHRLINIIEDFLKIELMKLIKMIWAVEN